MTSAKSSGNRSCKTFPLDLMFSCFAICNTFRIYQLWFLLFSADDGRWRVRKRLDERRRWLLHRFNWSRRCMDASKASGRLMTDATKFPHKFPSLRCSTIHCTQWNTLGKWHSHRQDPFGVHFHRTPRLIFKWAHLTIQNHVGSKPPKIPKLPVQSSLTTIWIHMNPFFH